MRNDGKFVKAIAVTAIVLALLVTAVQLLPTRELAPLSQRAEDRVVVEAFVVPFLDAHARRADQPRRVRARRRLWSGITQTSKSKFILDG